MEQAQEQVGTLGKQLANWLMAGSVKRPAADLSSWTTGPGKLLARCNLWTVLGGRFFGGDGSPAEVGEHKNHVRIMQLYLPIYSFQGT